ncbi:MAG: hypothetical protein NTY68_05200 [Candidatus Micrarchaeota archaeon]|nr:hypothetical protein [Candidatus Micrarchaeota archaeon]
MQKLKPMQGKAECKILEFVPKARQRPAMSLGEFIRRNNIHIIRNPNQREPIASLRPFQILEFRRNNQAEQKYK